MHDMQKIINEYIFDRKKLKDEYSKYSEQLEKIISCSKILHEKMKLIARFLKLSCFSIGIDTDNAENIVKLDSLFSIQFLMDEPLCIAMDLLSKTSHHVRFQVKFVEFTIESLNESLIYDVIIMYLSHNREITKCVSFSTSIRNDRYRLPSIIRQYRELFYAIFNRIFMNMLFDELKKIEKHIDFIIRTILKNKRIS